MNYNKHISASTILILLFNSIVVLSQSWTAGDNVTLNVSSYSLIDSNHAPIVMDLAPTTAGAPVEEVTNSDLFIKISSIVPGGTDRELTCRISAGSIPPGTYLTLASAPCTTTNSGGALGTPVSTPINLTTTDQLLVQFIGTCYTGTGYNDGYQMTFSWGPTDVTTNYGQIASETYSLTVVFTLTAHDGN